MAFAILAEAVAQKLGDPRKLNIPQSMAAAFIDYGLTDDWNGLVKKRLFGQHCDEVGRDLKQAHKFVFDPSFSRLVVELGKQGPETIERIFATARPPFECCWLEWDRVEAGGEDEQRVGVLVTPGRYQGYDVMVTRTMAAHDGTRQGMIIPGTLQIDFRRELDWQHDEVNGKPTRREPEDWMDLEAHVFGLDYYRKWGPGHRAPMSRLTQFASFVVGPPPFGPLLWEVVTRADRKGVDLLGGSRMGEFMQMCSLYVPSVFRELVCGLALLATHIGGGPLVQQRASKGKSLYYRGKFHPPVEYKILQLVRPMTAPRVIRRAFPAKSPGPTRWHQVIGAWHHRRAPAPACQLHPRACPVALWEPVHDDEGNPVGADTQACAVCQRHRWFVRDHGRGDPELGMVDKGYEVVAA